MIMKTTREPISQQERDEDKVLAEKYGRTIANKNITPGERKILDATRSRHSPGS